MGGLARGHGSVAEVGAAEVDREVMAGQAGVGGINRADDVRVVGHRVAGNGDRPHVPDTQLVVGGVLGAPNAGGDVPAVPGALARQIGDIGHGGRRTDHPHRQTADRHVIDNRMTGVAQRGRASTGDGDGVGQ